MIVNLYCYIIVGRHADNRNTMIRASQFSGVRLYSRKNIKIVQNYFVFGGRFDPLFYRL